MSSIRSNQEKDNKGDAETGDWFFEGSDIRIEGSDNDSTGTTSPLTANHSVRVQRLGEREGHSDRHNSSSASADLKVSRPSFRPVLNPMVHRRGDSEAIARPITANELGEVDLEEIARGGSPKFTRDEYLRLCRFRVVPFHKSPIARQWYDKDGNIKRRWYMRSSTTFDLMLDVVYGCIFMQMGRAFFESLDYDDTDIWRGIRAFSAMVLPVFLQWYETIEYLNRFDAEDCIHLLYFIFNIGAVCYLGLHLEDCSVFHYSSSCSGVILCLSGLRLGVTLMQAYASVFNYEHRCFILLHAFRNACVGIAFMALALFLPYDCSGSSKQTTVQDWDCLPWQNSNTNLMFWTVIIAEGTFILLIRGCIEPRMSANKKVPVDKDLLVERMGTMVTISITMMVVMCTFNDRMSYMQPLKPDPQYPPDDDVGGLETRGVLGDSPWLPPGPVHDLREPDGDSFLDTLLVAILAISLKIIYFNLDNPPAPSRSTSNGATHALSRSWPLQFLWTYMHVPLIMSIFLTGSCLFDQVQRHSLRDKFRWTAIAGLSIANGIMALFQLLHRGGGKFTMRRWRKRTRIAVRFLLSLVLPLLAFTGHCTNIGHARVFVCILCICFAAVIGLTLYGRQALDRSAALSGLSIAITESLLAEQLLSAPTTSGRSPLLSAYSPEKRLSSRSGQTNVSTTGDDAAPVKETVTLLRDIKIANVENSNLRRELMMLRQKQWALEKERDVAKRRDRESLLTVSNLRLKLRETMRELDERPPPPSEDSAAEERGDYDEATRSFERDPRSAAQTSRNRGKSHGA